MGHLITNQQKLNDVIFAGRNKEYGAYAIRSSYGNTILKSLSFMLLGVGSVFSIAWYLNKNNNSPQENASLIIHDSVYVIPVNLPAEEKPERSAPEENHSSPAENHNRNESTTIQFVDSTFSEKPDTAGQELLVSNTPTLPGTGATENNTLNHGTGSATSKPSGGKSGNEIKGALEVDSEPEFEGGIAALLRFVASHVKYPELAYNEGKEGTVYVKFVVDENGNVGQLSLQNAVGWGMDDEALRVVALIPKFKSPAKKDGEAVKVYYQLPIRFRYK